jgi:WD40 repeat protein
MRDRWSRARDRGADLPVTLCARRVLPPMRSDTRRPVQSFEGHSAQIRALAVSADGTCLVSGSDDRTVRVWNLATGGAVHTLAGHNCEVGTIAVARDSRRAVSGGADGMLLVWDLEKGRLLRRQSGCRRPVRAILITPDDQRVVAGGGTPYSARSSWIGALLNPTLGAWCLDTGKKSPLPRRRSLLMVTSLAITADGARLFADVSSSLIDQVFGSVALMNDRSFVHAWSLSAPQPAPPHIVAIHDGVGYAMAVSLDGQIAITAHAGSALAVWDVERKHVLRCLEGHAGSVTGIALLEDGARVLSASRDGTLLLWNLGASVDPAPLLLGRHDGPINALAMTPDERIVVTGGADRTIRLWNLPGRAA